MEYTTNKISKTDEIRILKLKGEFNKLNKIIPGTTYYYEPIYGHALESICIKESLEVSKINYRDTIYYRLNNTYITKDHKGSLLLYTSEPFSNDIFTILFLCASELNISKFINSSIKKIYHYNLEIEWITIWDSFIQEAIVDVANEYVILIEKMIQQNQFHIITNLDKFSARLNQGTSELGLYPLKDGILYQKQEVLKDIEFSYTQDELENMPDYLKLSRIENRKLYEQSKNALDQNCIQVIKAFSTKNIWTTGYYGPSGTGKTTTIQIIAGALNLPIIKVTGSRNIDEPYLFGKYILKNGSTEFLYGPLSLALKYGALFLFDEINMIEADVLSSLNDILEKKGATKVLENGEIITAHRNFCFGETMNFGYAGTNDLNISHKSRIQMKVKISKLSIEQNLQIIQSNSKISRKIAKKMLPFIDIINDLIIENGNEFSQHIDIRNIINWANVSIALDYDYIQAAIPTVIAGLLEEDITIQNSEVDEILLSDSIASKALAIIVEKMKD